MARLKASFDIDLLLHESSPTHLVNLLKSDAARILFLKK